MAGTQDTYFPGAVPVPEGETYDPDFSHPWLYTESRAIVIAGLIFSTLSLMLRVYTKAALLRKFGWDDSELPGAVFLSSSRRANWRPVSMIGAWVPCLSS
jgi:hypothetical protein